MDGVGFRGPVVHQGLPRWLIRLQSGLQDHELDGNARHKSQIYIGFVTPEFEGKLECINYMCARIKLHTRNDSVNIRYSAKA
jgi:hypothetical protein